jgi:hypothetical protein
MGLFGVQGIWSEAASPQGMYFARKAKRAQPRRIGSPVVLPNGSAICWLSSSWFSPAVSFNIPPTRVETATLPTGSIAVTQFAYVGGHGS